MGGPGPIDSHDSVGTYPPAYKHPPKKKLRTFFFRARKRSNVVVVGVFFRYLLCKTMKIENRWMGENPISPPLASLWIKLQWTLSCQRKLLSAFTRLGSLGLTSSCSRIHRVGEKSVYQIAISRTRHGTCIFQPHFQAHIVP